METDVVFESRQEALTVNELPVQLRHTAVNQQHWRLSVGRLLSAQSHPSTETGNAIAKGVK